MKIYIAALLCASFLLGTCGCADNQLPDAASSAETLIEIAPENLDRSLPDDIKGQCTTYELTENMYESDVPVKLYKADMNCTDGVKRVGYALSDKVTFLSDAPEDSKQADSIYSAVNNLALICNVSELSSGQTLDIVFDGLIKEVAGAMLDDDRLMVSNTVKLKSNSYLTSYILQHDSNVVEVFCLAHVLEEKDAPVQLYLLSRTFSSDASASTDQDDIKDIMRYCMSSDDNRDVFCGALQTLIKML